MSTQENKTEKPFLTARELCIMAMLTVLLFGQEQLMNFLPNINFTILLMVLYAKTFGFAKSSMMITVGIRWGIYMWQTMCQRLAPSTRLASISSGSREERAAR